MSFFDRLLHTPEPACDLDETVGFEHYARALTLRHFRLTWAVLCSLVVLIFPFDFVLYETSSTELVPVLRWQATVVTLTLLVALATRRSGPGARQPFAGALVIYTVAAAISGVLVAHAGGLEGSIFYDVHWAPLLIVPLMVKLHLRVAATLLVVGTYFTAFVLTDPHQLSHPTFASTAVWILMTSTAGVALGHVVYVLMRERYFQRCALDRHAQELTETDRMKSQFLANISHELRTPLTNILNALTPALAAPGAEWAATAQRNARHLLTLVDDLLLLAKLRHAPDPLTQWLDLGVLVRRVVGDFQTGGGLELRLELADDRRLVCHGDPRQLRQVVTNLLGNAIKFSPPGAAPIEIGLASAGTEARLTVRDHGIGIPHHEQERIFERFHQVEATERRRFGGVGIGLALTKEIVERCDGRISVTSSPGQGSTFLVRLPLSQPPPGTPIWPDGATNEPLDPAPVQPWPPRPAEEEEEPCSTAAAEDGRHRILVCEDDPDLRRSLRWLLAGRYAVTCASDGEEGLQRAQEQRPALVLADVMMPRHTGLELLVALRSDPGLARVPVIFLTARADADSKLVGLGLGANDYVTKPYDERELLARIDTQIELDDLRQNLERRVAEQTRALHSLAADLVSLQEHERMRIARDLHDDLGQQLASAGLEAEWLRMVHESAGPPKEDLGRGFERLAERLTGVRLSLDRTVRALRPRMLDELGLDAALTRMAESSGLPDEVKIEVIIDLDVDALSTDQSLAIYRIVQEGVGNIRRHAKAKSATISLREDAGRLLLDIEDDGVGFPLQDEPPPDGPRLGLTGMRERARLLGGRCEVTSAPGQGCHIRVEAPWPVAGGRPPDTEPPD